MSEISLGTIELEKGHHVGGHSIIDNLESQLDLLRAVWMVHKESGDFEQADIAMNGLNKILDVYIDFI